jgi:hypothetical protein
MIVSSLVVASASIRCSTPRGGASTSVAEAAVPESIVHYVVRTQESVILDDAAYKITREIPRDDLGSRTQKVQ